MRTNARLSLLAKEMVEGPEGRKKDLPEVSEDEGEAVPTATTTTTTSRTIEPQLALEWSFRPTNDPELLLKRTLAARALTAFFSVLTAHPKGLKAFSLACVEAYEANISAEELVQSVTAAEFDCEATTRGMFGKGADAPKLFAGFVSAAYLTAEYRLEQENKQQTEKKKTFAFANPPRWEEIDLSSSNGQDDIESRKKGNAYDYNFEFDEGRQIKYLEGFKTSIARWVSIVKRNSSRTFPPACPWTKTTTSMISMPRLKQPRRNNVKTWRGRLLPMTTILFPLLRRTNRRRRRTGFRRQRALRQTLVRGFRIHRKPKRPTKSGCAFTSVHAKDIKRANRPTAVVVAKIIRSGIRRIPRPSEQRDDDDQNDDDLSFKRNANNDFFAQSSITLASLNVQRAICSFVLKEMSNKSS